VKRIEKNKINRNICGKYIARVPVAVEGQPSQKSQFSILLVRVHSIEVLVYTVHSRGTKQRTQDPHKNGSAHMLPTNLLSRQKTTRTGPPACIECCGYVEICCQVAYLYFE